MGVDGGTIEDVVDELMDDYEDAEGDDKRVTMKMVGMTLCVYGMNSAKNIRAVVEELKQRGVRVVIG